MAVLFKCLHVCQVKNSSETPRYLSYSLLTLIQISFKQGEAGWEKPAKVVLQTLGVSYRVGQHRESDTRPVCEDNKETEARHQSHMKRILEVESRFFLPGVPSTLCHAHMYTHTRHHTLLPCLSLSFIHTHVAPGCLLLLLSDSHEDKTSPWILRHNCCRAIFVHFPAVSYFFRFLPSCLSSLSRSPLPFICSFSAFYLFRFH